MGLNKKNKPSERIAATTPTTAEFEAGIVKANEGKLWTYLVSEGSVLVNRVNAIADPKVKGGGMGGMLGFFAVATVIGSFAMFLSFGLSASDAVKGWQTNPAEINKWAAGASLRTITPALAAATTRSEDYARFVSEVVANPQTLVPQAIGGAKLGAIPCVPMESLAETWLNPATGTPDRPRCKFSGDSVFVASFVQDGSTGRSLIYPVLGVFHKDKEGWAYYNFDGGMEGGLFALRAQKSVSIYQIANEVNKAFPGVLVYGDVTAPRTAWGYAKKLFQKNN
jgi:hypothetical protein